MFERGVAGDCVVRCPICGSDDFLTVRFYSTKTDSDSRDETWVGCNRCGKWFVETEGKWAYAAWNAWACDRWGDQSTELPHFELYKLLAQEAETEKTARAQLQAVRSKIDDYVDRHVLAQSRWRIGDRFEARGWQRGIWSVASVEARYTINWGLIWIMKARTVLPGGSLGNHTREFLSGDDGGMRLLPPFWTPRRWDQVHAGDECLLGGLQGRIVGLSPTPRSAEVLMNDERIRIRRLSDIMVPVARVEAKGGKL